VGSGCGGAMVSYKACIVRILRHSCKERCGDMGFHNIAMHLQYKPLIYTHVPNTFGPKNSIS
jgi:hypothetical protein